MPKFLRTRIVDLFGSYATQREGALPREGMGASHGMELVIYLHVFWNVSHVLLGIEVLTL